MLSLAGKEVSLHANGTMKTRLPFNVLLTTEHSPFQEDIVLYSCFKCAWSKAVGKAWKEHPGTISKPLCLRVLETGSTEKLGYICLPPF